ncbi:hypothetical protein ACXN5S_01065 [Pseudoroseicyclus sp. H15]
MRPRHLIATLFAALLALPAAAQEQAPDNPALGMGLTGISDYSTEQPFIDQMKMARPWIGHLPGQWGGITIEQMQANGDLSPEGWPLRMPEGAEFIETFLLTDLPPEATTTEGIYLVEWAGEGRLSIGGAARDVRVGVHSGQFRYVPGNGLVSIGIRSIDPNDPIRDISVVRQDLKPLHDLGAIFDPEFIELAGTFRVLRFMDWMQTNGSPLATIADRPRPGDFSYSWRGVPVEALVALGNAAGTDIWVNMPHLADDAYVAAFAAYVEEALDPALKVYVEYSNELWNFTFPQTHWALSQAEARWGEQNDGWMQFAGMRAAEIADIWAAAFADAPERLVRVIGVHTGWPGLEVPLLEAPLAVAEGAAPPYESFDAYAVTGYFGIELGSDEMAGTVHAWAEAPDGFAQAAEALREGSFRQLLSELWPHHAEAAARHGLQLVAYEGGSHVVGTGALSNDELATDFFIRFNYSPQMAELYSEMLAAWAALGAGPFMNFVDVSLPSKWGSWGGQRVRGDDNPRWRALLAFNAGGSGAPRPEGTFETGLYARGSEAADELAGTARGDALLGLEGDDVLAPGVSGYSVDYVDGGEGDDRLLLPGAGSDWYQRGEGGVLVLTSRFGTIRAAHVERLRFDDGEERAITP